MKERVCCPLSTSPTCDNILKPISQRAQNILRRELHVGEPEAVHWPALVRRMCGSHPNTRCWSCDKWLTALSAASDKIRLKCCPDSHEASVHQTDTRSHILYGTGSSVCVDRRHLPCRIFDQLQVSDRRRTEEARVIAAEGKHASSQSTIREVVARFSRIPNE